MVFTIVLLNFHSVEPFFVTSEKSILDRIIESRNIEQAAQFSPAETIAELLKELSLKEREVISRRFGLGGEPSSTLEEIGRRFQITRERIRQIQSAAVRKIRELAAAKQQLHPIAHTVTRMLHEHGGVIEDDFFFRQLLAHIESADEHRPAAAFIVSQLLPEHVERVRPSDHLHPGWKLKLVDLEFVRQALAVFVSIIEAKNSVLRLEHLVEEFKRHPFFQEHQQRLIPLGSAVSVDEAEAMDRILRSYLTISRRIEQNLLGEWGLSSWPTIRPRRMGDKIYLVLKQVGKPLHFTEITQQINAAKIDHKVAYPATIHNELILDDRYVLVGRGMYALKEWGYHPGTVQTVVAQVLTEAGKPLTREEIVREVLKRRFVRKSTILLALANRERFAKAGDHYQLASTASSTATAAPA